MKEITNNDISHLKDKECLFLFYFTASWCGPCKRIYPLIEKISEGLDESKVEIYKVDIDENDELASDLKVKSVPTFYLFKQKELLGQCSGTDIKKVHSLIKEYIK
jgi:thioredoxin 1